jgi:N-acetylneuraminate lyase
MLRKLVDHFVVRKLDGLYLCGSTGEGVFMSVEERELVTETVMSHVKDQMPVIVHVGSTSTLDAARLARHARDLGAAGISTILPPVTFDPRSVVAHFEAIAAAVPELPFLPYVFGGARDAVSLMRDLLHIPNLAGTKYYGPNMYELSHLIALRNHDWTVMAGMDEQCLFAAMFGAHGSIGSTANVMPGVYQQIYQCYQTGDLMRGLELQKRANQVIDILISFGFTGAFKETLRYLGFDCGKPRLPNLALPEAQCKELQDKLEAVGFAELAAL